MEGGLAKDLQAVPHAIPQPSRKDRDEGNIRAHRPSLHIATVSDALQLPSAKHLPQPTGFYAVAGKRVFDKVFSAAFLLLVGSWMFPLIALAIRMDTRGPVLYHQRRVGYHGEIFECLKFRTMVHDPDAQFVQATKDDPRITYVGAFLRRTNLDETPQFINALMGQMSIVGPRPHVRELGQLFESWVPGYAVRNQIRPGITGLAQVSGCRGETRSVREMANRVRFDGFYLRNMGFFLDLTIIARTVLIALRGDEKAY